MKNPLSLLIAVFLLSNSSLLLSQSDVQTFRNSFNENDINRIDLSFETPNWRYMLDISGVLIEGDITINNGQTFKAKVARKGNSANINTRGRDKFPIKVDGPKGFNFKLNNNYRDYTAGAREYIGYKLHREFTGIGSEIAATEVFVNGDFYGFYLAVEDINNTFYKKNIGNISQRVKATPTEKGAYENRSSSNLFWLGSSPEVYDGRYEVKKGSINELIRLIDIINNSPSEAYLHLDIEQITRFLAVENYLLNTDGIIGDIYSHNYELVKRDIDGLWQLVPWDLNLCLGAWSKPSVEKESSPINIIAGISPTSGKMNNALIELIMNEYFYLYHYQYRNLLKEYDGDKLVAWAKKYKAIVNKNTQNDSKLYDAELINQAYDQNLTTVDGFVTGLIPTITQRYSYLKSLDLDTKFSNKIKSVSQIQDTINIQLVDGIESETVIIEYLDADNNMKKLRASKAENKKGTYFSVLPKDASSYYVYTFNKGIKYSHPYNGILSINGGKM